MTNNEKFVIISIKDKHIGFGNEFKINDNKITLRRMEIFLNELPYKIEKIDDLLELEPFTIQVQSTYPLLSDELPDIYTGYYIIEFPVSYNTGTKYVFIDIKFSKTLEEINES